MRFGLVALVAFAACGGDSGATADASLACSGGEQECRADGVYTCDLNGQFTRTQLCTNGCEATPTPHCARSCADPGVVSICDNNAVKQCTGGAEEPCTPGVCITSGDEAVCATVAGATTCAGTRQDGSAFALVCADANGVSTTQACDVRSGECAPAQYDCAQLASVADGSVTCDAATGDFFTACDAGQPATLPCDTGSACSNDGTLNCYTAPTAGATCGGSTVCYPGLHCTQTAATDPSCVQPAGQIACNDTDVLAVCTDSNTGFACVNGTVWRWNNLTAWGGSCTSNHVSLPAGGNCIPGLADCQQGLACDRSPYDIAGTCRTPPTNAPAECTLTGQLSTGLSCAYAWHACADGHYYDVSCTPMNIAGNIITLCECEVDGEVVQSFGGSEVCNVTDVGMLDAQTRASCGWDVTTVDVAP